MSLESQPARNQLGVHETSDLNTLSGLPSKKYERSKEPFDSMLQEINELMQLKKIPSDEWSENNLAVLREAIAPSKDAFVSFYAVTLIRNAPEHKRAALIRQALELDTFEIAKAASELIWYVPRTERAALETLVYAHIQRAIKLDTPQTALTAARMILQAPMNEKGKMETVIHSYIPQALASENLKVAKGAAEMIQYAQEHKRTELIQHAFALKNPEVANTAATVIGYAPEHERTGLIRQAFALDAPHVALTATKMIRFAPEHERTGLIRQAFALDAPHVALTATKMIWYVPKRERVDLERLMYARIQHAFGSENPELVNTAVEMIEYVPEDKRTRLIQQAFALNSPHVALTAARMIWYAPEKQQAKLTNLVHAYVQHALEAKNSEFSSEALEMIPYTPENKRMELVQQVMARGINVVQSPLYRDYPHLQTKSFFKRESFDKTGSETTLLGGSLYDKVILRMIPTISFLAWKKAYEAHDIWKKQGFDYIPVEPIVRAYLQKNGQVHVYTTVLDCNLQHWAEISGGLFSEELVDIKEKIKNILTSELNVRHGHLHARNFVLSFSKNPDGSLNVSRCPRLYVIDFDQAMFH